MIPLKKVLFTDLFGTLISLDSDDARKLYGGYEKEFAIVSRYMNEFLREDNYIAIVTEPGGHGNFGRVFNNQIANLNSYIDDNLRSHLAYYLQGNGTISEEDHIRKEMVNGKLCYIGKHPFTGIAVNKKEEAVIDFLKMIPMPYQIYGIGDSAKDIPMLLKIQELYGNSSFMDTRLYSYQSDFKPKDIIAHEVEAEFHYELIEILKKRSFEEIKVGIRSKAELELLIKKDKRKQELYQLLNEGNLDLEELMKNYSKYIECKGYEIENENTDLEHPFYEDYPYSKEVIQRVMGMPCYPTFAKYYTKVLKRK